MTCFYCGTELPAGAMFCGECGRPVNTRGGRSPRGSAKTSLAPTVVEAVAEVPVGATPPAAAPAVAEAPVDQPLDEAPAQAEPVAEEPAEPVQHVEEPEQPQDVWQSSPGDEPEVPTQPEEPAQPEQHDEPERQDELNEEAAEPDPVPELLAADPEPAPVNEPELAPPAEESIAEDGPASAAEPERQPTPLVDPPVAEDEPEPVPTPESFPVAEPDVQPSAVAEAPAPAPEAAPAPAPAPDAATAAERCAQCGAALGPADIFCPECGFVRQRASARPRPSDTNVLDPFPWGLPRPTGPVATQHHPTAEFAPDEAPRPVAPDASAALFAEVADVAETRLVPRGPRGERFVLQFSTGESVSVSGSGLVGRNPAAEPGEYFDALIAIVDPGRSVSKTHLEFGQDGTSFWVSDRYSGNGTVVREPDRDPRRCEAGKRYRVVRGARVEIGEQFFIVS